MAEIDIGPVILDSDVENAVRDTMKRWVPYYLSEIDEAKGRARGTTDPPRSWLTASEGASRWAEETPPALMVQHAGLTPNGKHGRNASYHGIWQVNIGVTAAGATEPGSRDLAARLTAAVRFVIAQQGDMGGFAEDTVLGPSRTDVEPRDRLLVACETIAFVHVSGVVDTRGNLPRTAPGDPTDPAPDSITPSGYRIRVDRSLPSNP